MTRIRALTPHNNRRLELAGQVPLDMFPKLVIRPNGSRAYRVARPSGDFKLRIKFDGRRMNPWLVAESPDDGRYNLTAALIKAEKLFYPDDNPEIFQGFEHLLVGRGEESSFITHQESGRHVRIIYDTNFDTPYLLDDKKSTWTKFPTFLDALKGADDFLSATQ